MKDIKIQVDTNLLNEYASDLLSLVNDYNSVIYELYNELYNISNNEIWVGAGATKWIESLGIDKDKCLILGKMLYSYGKSISNFADNLDNTLKKCDIND